MHTTKLTDIEQMVLGAFRGKLYKIAEHEIETAKQNIENKIMQETALIGVELKNIIQIRTNEMEIVITIKKAKEGE
jgi:hypothetical protein